MRPCLLKDFLFSSFFEIYMPKRHKLVLLGLNLATKLKFSRSGICSPLLLAKFMRSCLLNDFLFTSFFEIYM